MLLGPLVLSRSVVSFMLSSPTVFLLEPSRSVVEVVEVVGVFRLYPLEVVLRCRIQSLDVSKQIKFTPIYLVVILRSFFVSYLVEEVAVVLPSWHLPQALRGAQQQVFRG